MKIQDYIKERVLILDGGLGTMIQQYPLDESDFRTKNLADSSIPLKGNNELLNLTHPEIIEEIHRKYLIAGADIIETNTFNAQRISQSDYGCEELCYQMNYIAASLARKIADEFSTENNPRFVAGSIGPTNKTCSIGTDIEHPEVRSLNFDTLENAYEEQIAALIDGGVDIIMVETIFDTLNAKAALYATRRIFRQKGVELPIMISVTLSDKGGHTLSGQDLKSFLTSIEFANPFSLGLNCSFGPKEMMPFVETLSQISPYPLSLYPNAGLPNELGEYDITPNDMGEFMKEFTDNNLVNIIGGCCGTTDKHIAQYQQVIKTEKGTYKKPRIIPVPKNSFRVCGLSTLEIDKNTSKFVTIGERCNVAGSKKFLRLINNHQYDEALQIARKQINDGALVIDINMDDGLLDAKKEMITFINLITSDPITAQVPLMIDSSRFDVIVEALKSCQGKCIVNSISLKEGEQSFIEKASIIKDFGAAVVVMAFDEVGQACTYEQKIKICERAYNILTQEVKFKPQDIIFDPNILSIATGMTEHDNYAVNFIDATEWIKKNLPLAHISGGISNLSFSFRGNNYIREAMHCVFLYHAIKKGMDFGIVNPSSKLKYEDIPEELRNLLENLIFNRKRNASDELLEFINNHKTDINSVSNTVKENDKIERKQISLEDRLKEAIIKGIDDYLDIDLQEAIQKFDKVAQIIDGPLMEGMETVGERFAEGKMFLPQVVRTAKVMQKAVQILSPHILATQKKESKSAGKILMATVKGDVHDIGKNIVSVVLTCNNFEVIDLGVMTPKEDIIQKAISENVDMIGLCGLITPSLIEMENVVKALNQANLIHIPVIIGGATTSELHTALKISPAYKGSVIWSKDAAQTTLIATTLMNKEKREEFLSFIHNKYEQLRNDYKLKQEAMEADKMPIEVARKNKLKLFNTPNCTCCKIND